MPETKRLILIFIILLLNGLNFINAQNKKGISNNSKSIAGSPSATKMNINNVSAFIRNNGQSDQSTSGDSGFQYPNGSGKTAFYASGPLWGGIIENYWAVGGASYRSGLLPGRILPDGTAESESLPHVRIFRVRSDYKNCGTGDDKKNFFAKEIADENRTVDEIYAQYDLDWKEWPAQYGAPYTDKDKDGVYDPDVDIPGMSEVPCQTTWYVANDLSSAATLYLYGSLPMKLEMQATIWAYKTDGIEGNTIYKRYRLINKNSKKIDSMYLLKWSDPDIGGAFDDFAGCDTTLSLGFVYNGVGYDDIYKLTPPAAGFILLQSPYVKGENQDIAMFDKRELRGNKNLGMTAFYVGLKSALPDWADPLQGDYIRGSLAIKNLLQSKLLISGVPVVDPVTNKSTRYPVSGDPINRSGWYDGKTWSKGDRRIGLISGPFTMNPDDTQQVVVAQVAVGGTGNVDNLNAVSMLKHYAGSILYKWKAQVEPVQPVSPIVSVSQLNENIILNWGELNSYTNCEKDLNSVYKFQGYNVYQMPSAAATKEEGEIITTYDLNDDKSLIYGWVEDPVKGYFEYRVVGYGKNSGIKRYCSITKDAIRNNLPLYNFSKYYFGVTAYYVADNPDAVPQLLESPLQVLTTIPQEPLPGTRITTGIGDKIYPDKSDITGASATVEVIDPLRVTGHSYEIYFQKNWYKKTGGTWVPIVDTSGVSEPVQYRNEWFLKDKTSGVDVLAYQTVYGGVDEVTGAKAGDYTSNADGLKINITGNCKVPDTFSEVWENWGILYDTETGRYNSSAFNIADNRIFGKHGGTALEVKGKGTNDPMLLQSDFYLDFNGIYETINIGGKTVRRVASGGQLATLYGAENYSLADHPLNPNPGSNNPFLIRVPFFVVDNEKNKHLNLRVYDYAGSLTDSLFKVWNDNGRMDFEIVATEYSENVIPNNSALLNQQTWAVIMFKSVYSFRDIIIFEIINPIIPGSTRFTFTAPSVMITDDFLKEDTDKINVFPNPYYGANPQEVNAYQRFVTFTHLPNKARIKILNIAGQLIKTIYKEDSGQVIRWNLATEGNLYVPSGIYVAHIELPDLGKVKILKFAVILEQQYPLHY